MGVSRIRVNIDRLVLNGFRQLEGKALAEALQSQLCLGLADATSRSDWARSRRTTALKMGPVPLETGAVGARKLGSRIGQAVIKGLKP
jgi:hypothetical protein